MSTTTRTPAATGHQFYVTHSTTADSVLNAPGYSVRAASTLDPDGLIRALQYPPYELPLEMWKEKPSPSQAPRRLALTDNTAGGFWVVHSVLREQDSMGRDRSYFSHMLALADARPAAVLRSWGADAWVTSYPDGETKTLAADPKLPVGSLVGDATATAFLGDRPTGPTDLGVAVCPARLRSSVGLRHDLFARMLMAMHALTTRATEHGRRLYVHGEPGLVALLLYGAVRLLPAEATTDLTFSTYEPPHRNLRDYTMADVVGTYLGSPDKGLDPDLGTTRGIVLDTFNPARSSPALAARVPAGVAELIERAAAGRWGDVPPPTPAAKPEPFDLGTAWPPPSVVPPAVGTYSAQITRTSPACLLLLIDQSGSMNQPFAGGTGQTKAGVVADAVNRLLQNVVLRSAKADGVRDYFRVGVLGYGRTIKSGLSGDGSEVLIPGSQLGAHPLRVETRTKLVPDGVGGLVEQPVMFPVWFDPESGGKTPMCEALATAALVVRGFVDRFPDSYPPIVLNLTDGLPTDGDPQENARAIRGLGTRDGPALLFNLLISSKPVPAEYFPADEDMMADNFSKLLFRMSSKLPQKMWEAAQAEGLAPKPDARGVVLNADPAAIVRFLDIGTRITPSGR